MIVESFDGSFINKGDQLMLWAVIEHLRGRFKDVKIVMDPQRASYAERANYGLYQKMGERRYGRLGFLIDLLMHRSYREKFGLVTDSEIDAVLDISGFAYGDAWGTQWLEQRARSARRWRKQGKKVVLLPQALGPFQNPRVRELACDILGSADLVCARDAVSREAARHLGIPDVLLSPDITHLVEGLVPEGFHPPSPWTCVIPNWQMIHMTSGAVRDRYPAFLVAVIKELMARNLNPHILQHEVQDDSGIIAQLETALGNAVPVIREENPVHLKGIIGTSFLAVASRYHGLVNALSQAVPALATSWSHKYGELLTEYGCPENLIAPDTSPAEIAAKIDAMTRASTRKALITKLKETAALQKEKVKDMWDRVDALLAG